MKNIEENIILTNLDIEKKIERISLQILESNSDEKKIIFFERARVLRLFL